MAKQASMQGGRAAPSESSSGGSGGGAAGRLIGALVLLALLAAAVMALLAVAGVDPARLVGGFEPGQNLLEGLAGRSMLDRGLIGAGAVLLGVAAIALLLRALAGGGGRSHARQPSSSRHLLVADDHGFVLVESRGIAIVATTAALRVPGVVDAQVSVEGTGGSPVRLRVQLQIHPGADVKRTGTGARDAVHEAVERLVGIDVAEVAVNVRVLEPDDLARVLS